MMTSQKDVLTFFGLALAFGLCQTDAQEVSSTSQLSTLRNSLFLDYDKYIKPDGQVTVKYSLDVADISLCAHAQRLKITGWAFHFWNDSRLMWNPEDFNGISTFKIVSSELWIPDITLYNSMGEMKSNLMSTRPHSDAIVSHDGLITYVPPLTMTSMCSPNTTNWPWGEQNCTLIVGSWSYELDSINILPEDESKSPLNTANLLNNRIDIIGTSFQRSENEYRCCPGEIFPSLNLNLMFKQNSKFIGDKLVTPTSAAESKKEAKDSSEEDSSEEEEKKEKPKEEEEEEQEEGGEEEQKKFRHQDDMRNAWKNNRSLLPKIGDEDEGSSSTSTQPL
eukprot:maker-scaffold19_size710362-snap-gene-4.17 protein:Tk00407 transcript:maker-scaffold19_size710362-snap-gene-4.17-mRNA-1 annotation:"neuronal acetylcholine receptor subunit alpha-3"